MPVRYLVELRPAEDGFADIQSLGARSRAASEELSRNGTPVRFLRSVFVPEDSSCLLVFEGASAEAVTEACRRAAIVAERISAALDLTEELNEEAMRSAPDSGRARRPLLRGSIELEPGEGG
jgi:hypothetical protein